MRIAVYGATGMVGQGVLRECLLDPEVTEVVTFGRARTGHSEPKLREIVLPDLLDYAVLAPEQLAGFDACFFCLGVTSAGMTEADYTRITHDYAVAAGRALLANSPQATFVFVSGAGTDSSERGKVMWARVKGKAENALLAMPFRAVFTFRPAFIEPLHGIKSRTRAYNVLYVFIRPLVPLLRRLIPSKMTTTERIGRAMLRVAREGYPKRILESQDIDQLGR